MRSTKITGLAARRVWTFDGAPALEVDVFLACGVRGRGTAAPASNAWRAPHAASHNRASPLAVDAVNLSFAAALNGIDAVRQEEVDAALRALSIGDDPWVTRAARSACSVAAAQAAARAAGIPLFRHLRPGVPARMPMPVIDVACARADASPFRALAIVPFIADGVDEALALAVRIHRTLSDLLGQQTIVDEQTIQSLLRAIEETGFVPAEEIGIALDVGAARLHRDDAYVAADGAFDAERWRARLVRAVENYPLCAIADPLADATELSQLAPLVDHRARIVADELFASDMQRISEAIASDIASAAALRPEAAGTLTELRAAFAAARAAAWPVLAAANTAGEDGTVAHIATAWQASYVKLGGINQGGMAGGNELLRIEGALQPVQSALRIEAAARLVH
jgi:enolase